MTDENLSTALSKALATEDGTQLIPLYKRAAQQAETEVQRGFFLTHAYVHALETGDNRASELRGALVAMGREN